MSIVTNPSEQLDSSNPPSPANNPTIDSIENISKEENTLIREHPLAYQKIIC
jgi:hypothetical protein